MAFSHKVPRQLQDEDRWFKIFTFKQAIAAAVCAVIGLPIGIMLAKIHFMVMLVIMVLYIMICGFLIFFRIPSGQYMLGGGQYGVSLILRILYRSLNKKVYVKHKNGGEDH